MVSPDAEITVKDALVLMRNLLRIAIFNEKNSTPAFGVYDASHQKFLKSFQLCEGDLVDGHIIEDYALSFSYSDSDKEEVSMNLNNLTTDIIPQKMRLSSDCKMITKIVRMIRTLEKMPEERTILMKLLYCDDLTAPNYEPPFFRGCTEEEVSHQLAKVEVGDVNSKHSVLALKVKSMIDPCEDDNEGIRHYMSTGDDSIRKDKYYETEDFSQGDPYVVTYLPVEDEQQLPWAKEWCCCLDGEQSVLGKNANAQLGLGKNGGEAFRCGMVVSGRHGNCQESSLLGFFKSNSEDMMPRIIKCLEGIKILEHLSGSENTSQPVSMSSDTSHSTEGKEISRNAKRNKKKRQRYQRKKSMDSKSETIKDSESDDPNTSTQIEGTRKALLIGIESRKKRVIWALPSLLRRLRVLEQKFGFEKKNVKILCDVVDGFENPTEDAITKEVLNLIKSAAMGISYYCTIMDMHQKIPRFL